jgi:hypothetical protein
MVNNHQQTWSTIIKTHWLLISENLQIPMKQNITCPNVVAKFKLLQWNQNPTHGFFKVNPLAGASTHEKAGKSETLEKQMAPEMSVVAKTYEHVFKRWGRSGVDLGSYAIILELRKCVFWLAIRISRSQSV